jgi:RimJ/RimL family protein N-acetyltransferase
VRDWDVGSCAHILAPVDDDRSGDAAVRGPERQGGIESVWPLFGLHLDAGPLILSPVSDEEIPALVRLAAAGVHQPETMPFSVPWTDAPPEALGHTMAAYYWRTRAELSPSSWTVDFVVRWLGEIVGVQGLITKDYPVTRSCETGSWLGLAHQGRGIGTLMRQTICAFAFDHLAAQEVTSSAWIDNRASLAVSAKVGYQDNGQRRQVRRPGELATMQHLVLMPSRLVRHHFDLEVHGLGAVREFLGIDHTSTSPSNAMH